MGNSTKSSNIFKELFFIDKDMLREVYRDVADENQSILRAMSMIVAIVLGLMTVSALYTDSINSYIPIYVSFFILSVLSYLISRGEFSAKTVSVQVYVFLFLVLLFGVILGTVFSPDELTVSYVVLMFAIPPLFIIRPSISNSIIVATVLIYIIIAKNTQVYELYRYNMINVIVFGLMSMVITSFMVRLRLQRAFYLMKNATMEMFEKEAIEAAASHDKLTGCKNRNSLVWAYEGDFDKQQPIAVIMCDLNGLKSVNDMQGHKAGDEFITKSASVLKDIFGIKNVYRIGGDEFIVVLLGRQVEDLHEKIKELHERLGSTVSLGVKEANSVVGTFDDLLKEADQKMYAEKQKYYAQNPDKKDAHQAIMEYKTILANAGLGIWHIILNDGEKPKMQVDAKMAELLSVDTDKLSEEAVYTYWRDRIEKDSMESVKLSSEEMIAGNFSENTYRWNHPTKGQIYVRCGGTALALNDGTKLLSGYFGDVTNIVMNSKKHMQHEKED